MKNVVIFGAGIAGLSAAHELADLGYDVSVYESSDQPGGFFRSARLKEHDFMPTEYSWHGMGPWYNNTFDLMKKIPFNEKGNIYDLALSRPIDFGIFPNKNSAKFYNGISSIPKMFGMNLWSYLKWSYLMLKTWTSNNRSKNQYSKINAADAWKFSLSKQAFQSWIACFGPWIGSDWTQVSLHTAGEFFRKQLTSIPVHHHLADVEGAAWTQGKRGGWLLFKGPSSEYWFNPWVKYLETKGVKFYWNTPLTKLLFDGTEIVYALSHDEKINGDDFILAINPFMAASILKATPHLEEQEVLKKFSPLVQDGRHVQVSFRVAFSEEIKFPKKRTAVVVCDSEFNLTLFAEEQVWNGNINLGPGIKSLWTGTACCSSNPGQLFGKSVNNCTKEEFIEEIKAQIYCCESLNEMIKEANCGKSLDDFNIIKIEVWHEWKFSHAGISGGQPKWVNNSNNQEHQPEQRTPVNNLFLAGAHTKTQADVWSIEGAVESGRRAAKLIDDRIIVINQERPTWIKIFNYIDDFLYQIRFPHFIDILLLIFLVLVLSLIPFLKTL